MLVRPSKLHCTCLQSGSTAVVVRSNTRPAVVTVRSMEALRERRNKQVVANNNHYNKDYSDVHKGVGGIRPHIWSAVIANPSSY